MTAPVAATKSYDLSGNALRESLADVIYDISPMDTTFLSGAGRGTIDSTLHEWQTDALAAAALNAKLEGDDFSGVARTLPSRLKNYAQISRKDIVVSGTSKKLNLAGIREIMAYHVMRVGKELKRDIEHTLLNTQAATAGSSVSARASASVPHWIYSGQHYKTSAQTTQTTTAPASGFAKSVGTVWTASATAYVENDLRDMLKLAWSTGGEVGITLCDSVAFNKFSTFTGVATRFRDVASRQPAQVIGYSDVFVSAYGTTQLKLSRYMPANSAYCLDMSTWEVAYLRPFQTVEIGKTGDSDKKMLLAEWSLCAKTPTANSKAHGIS